MWTAKTLIRLGGCPGWSESSLGAQSLCWFCHVMSRLIYFHAIYRLHDYKLHGLSARIALFNFMPLSRRQVTYRFYRAGLNDSDWGRDVGKFSSDKIQTKSKRRCRVAPTNDFTRFGILSRKWMEPRNWILHVICSDLFYRRFCVVSPCINLASSWDYGTYHTGDHWMAAYAPLKNEFTEHEKCPNLMRWLNKVQLQSIASVLLCTLKSWVSKLNEIIPFVKMSRIMTKPTEWLCAQRRLRSVWASAQSDQSLRCALSG